MTVPLQAAGNRDAIRLGGTVAAHALKVSRTVSELCSTVEFSA